MFIKKNLMNFMEIFFNSGELTDSQIIDKILEKIEQEKKIIKRIKIQRKIKII